MNTFGNNFRVSIFGESHGPQIGVTLDGIPAGLPLKEADFSDDINRRRAGAIGTTPRKENDLPHIISGVYKGHTTGAPLTIVFENENANGADYEKFIDQPRPGHADFSAGERFSLWNDPRGGGHFSGRLTLCIVAAGVVAKKVLSYCWDGSEEDMCGGKSECNSKSKNGDKKYITAEVIELGGLKDKKKWAAAIDAASKAGDSLGAIVECEANVPAGLGEPFWNSVESLISHAVFAIPGVRGIEFGDGFAAAGMKGSEHNDPFGPDGVPTKNGSGGVNGGITNGAPLKFRVAFKPTSSIAKDQKTLNFKTGKMETLKCGGRHDVCFALRAPVVVEAMTAIVLADL